MADHTPSPWETVGDPPTEIGAMMGTPDCIIVADTALLHGIPTDRQLADARLIAAAPDLLKALTEVSDGMNCWCPWRHEDGGRHTRRCLQARAAISKAIGQVDVAGE